MKYAVLPVACVALALAACSGPGGAGGGPGGSRMARGERPPLPSIGDPGKVAAADIAFAKAAREQGQWTAFREFAAPGAIIHGRNGGIEAEPWLATQEDPPESVRWAPTAVWTSCDGTLAASFGRYVDPDGTIGSYVTMWALQADRSYKWIYDVGAPDDPQPPPPPPDIEPDEDTIVVSALTSIEGKVADCQPGESQPPSPIALESAGAVGASRDSTLVWQWHHFGEGERSVRVHYLRNGAWEQAVEMTIPAAGG